MISIRALAGASLVTIALLLSSCGGGTSSSPPPPLPPPPSSAADFSLSVEVTTVTLQQGGALQFQSVQATPVNGFTGTVNLSFSGLPTGISTTPAGPYSITVSASAQLASFQLGAGQTAPVGNTTVTVTGTSGALTHTAKFSLVVSPAAPFQIQVSPATISMTPASTATVQISATASAGTSPQLSVNASGPPNSSQITVGSPQGFLTPTNPLSFSLIATSLAQPLQNFPMTITASDNNNNTAMAIVPLTVTIPFSANTTPTRSSFFKTDKSATGMVYDSIRKLVFVSVEILNEVEVISSIDGHEVASIPVNFPSGIDEAANGSAVYVVSPYFGGVTIIDPNLLQVVGQAQVPQSVSGSTAPVVFLQVAALSNGKVVLNPASDSFVPGKPPFYLWDPVASTFSLFGPNNTVFQEVLISRSADHSKLIAGSILYDASTNSFIATSALSSGIIAINPDGSQIASTTYLNSSPVYAFYDSNFNLLGTLPYNAFWVSGPSPQLFYSLSGKYLYIIPDQSIGVGDSPGGAVTVVDTKTFSILGLVPAFSFGAALPFSGQWITTFALDESDMLFGAAYGGVGLLDLSSPTALTEPLPASFLVQPSLASLTSPTQAQLNGVGFSQGAGLNLFVGPPPSSPQSLKATDLSVQSDNFVQLTIPPGNTAGPANATLTRSDGYFEVMPNAVTFGPTVLRVDADAGSPDGGDTVNIVGYGLDASGTEVSIGGNAATISQTRGAISGQAFPTETITVKTPPGLAGRADVTVSTPDGSVTEHNAFQYFNSMQVYAAIGALDAITYDATRKHLYISNQDHNRVETFDLSTNQFLSPVMVGNAPTSLAITPDAQLLAVVNSADGTASVIDPAKMQVVATYPLLTTADQDKQACGGVVTEISPVTPHRLMISVNCTSLLDGGVAHLINLDTGSLSCTGVAGCSSNGTDLNLGLGPPVTASSWDGTRIFFTANNVGVLDLTSNSLTSYGTDNAYSDCSADEMGDVFAANFGTYGDQATRISIMAFEPYADSGSQSLHNVFGEKLNPSGSLLFYPQDSGVDIFDVHTGRLVRHVALPDPIPLDTNGMALDETGTKMFLISSTGITVAQLYRAPLSLATVNPANGAPGTSLTLRGSGFENGVTVTIGTTQVSVTYIDQNTIQAVAPNLAAGPIRVTINNPDGTQYSLDDAFIVN